MARGRMISRALSTSRKFASLHHTAGPLAEFCQSLYMLLVAHADDHGRQSGDAFTVKHAIVPASPRTELDVASALKALHVSGLVAWYQVGDDKFLQIQDFDSHQSGLHKRTPSKFPDVSGKFPEIPGDSLLTELKGTELNGTEGNGTEPPPKAAPRAPLHSTAHRAHAHCGRVCVPAFLHDQFRRNRNHVDADKELRDWYLSIDHEWSIGLKSSANTGSDELKFWRERFAEKWPADTVAKPMGKTAGNAVAIQNFVDKMKGLANDQR